ncbi:LysR substrate-binding domain-containing protein [Rhodovarius lipocyclicus]|uniref:LysR substrate-binding domain-containing protein n=1 Tax=Rhodovarius lipocyclicus TaxID=268410 RepID=UPI00135B732A|nr:LysR substrate-binding domain-containing protein [Rhodovarius lipocyclicus]
MPSLNALRAFEAAARHRSITRAAEELSVTPGAVSRQVKELEAALGASLLDRRPDGLHPTPAGALLAEATGRGLSAIRAGLEAVRAGHRRLSIGAYSAFAQKWLIPRWARFADAHPDVELALTTTHAPADLRPERFDATILVTDRTQWPGHTLHRLLPIETTPVCAPGPVPEWPRARLLHARPRPRDWPRWLAEAGVTGVDALAGPVFESITLAAEAAAQGLGLAMGIRALLAEDLAADRLVAPFAQARLSRHAFVLAVPSARAREPAIAAFTAWALAEAGMA